MARADRRRAAREARNARASGSRRARGGSRTVSAQSVESQLFFTRLRTQAKWAFALMVIVFGAGFAFLGVGSGGLDLGQMIRDVFGSKGGGGTSISKALKDVDKHPRSPAAYRKLADAYHAKGKTDEEISALQQWSRLAPKNTDALTRLANLQIGKAEAALADAQAASYDQQTAQANQTFGASPSSKLGQALNQDPITAAVSAKVQQRSQEAQARYQSESSAAIATVKKLAKARPDGTSFSFLAQTALKFYDTATAISAYKSWLKVANDPGTKRLIRSRLAQLQPPKKGGG